MYPVGSFERMKSELYNREEIKGSDIPITVGILIADVRRQFCRENLINYIDIFNKKSGKLIDFYIPGYCQTEGLDKNYKYNIELNEMNYCFSSELFNDFISKLETLNVKITGRTQFILIEYKKNRLDTKNMMVFDLEKDEKENRIDSTYKFLNYIISIANKTVMFEEFRSQIKIERSKRSLIQFAIKNIPDKLLKLLMV